MSNQQKKRARRRERITGRTLVIGVDVGKEFNALVVTDWRGQVLRQLKRVYNSRKGYEWMTGQIREIQSKKRYRKIVMGLEPTGHYWRKVAHRAHKEGMEVVFVKTTALKHQRKLDQSSRAKSDVRDALLIANLVREGKYCDTVVGEDIYRQLRRVVKERERVRKLFSATQNRLVAWLDDYFPELRGCFGETTAKSLLALLRKYPTPEEVKSASLDELAALLGKASRRRKQAREKAGRIQREAARSICLSDVGDGDRLRLKLLLDDLEYLQKQKKVLEGQLAKLLEQTGYGEYLLSVKGVGPVTAAAFLGELGDPKNFRRAKEVVSYSGLDPFESESGQVFGRRSISKEGRFLLRATLYRMSVSVIRFNRHLRAYYRRLLKGGKGKRKLEKKEALCAVAIKLAKLLFALLRDQRAYQKQAPRYKKVA